MVTSSMCSAWYSPRSELLQHCRGLPTCSQHAWAQLDVRIIRRSCDSLQPSAACAVHYAPIALQCCTFTSMWGQHLVC